MMRGGSTARAAVVERSKHTATTRDFNDGEGDEDMIGSSAENWG
jgi:hypothetical protein